MHDRAFGLGAALGERHPLVGFLAGELAVLAGITLCALRLAGSAPALGAREAALVAVALVAGGAGSAWLSIAMLVRGAQRGRGLISLRPSSVPAPVTLILGLLVAWACWVAVYSFPPLAQAVAAAFVGGWQLPLPFVMWLGWQRRSTARAVEHVGGLAEAPRDAL